MAELKTTATTASVEEFLNQVQDEKRRQDCFTIVEIMSRVTGSPPKMWGTSIIGFGDTHLKYESGRELDWFLTGFSPRKQDLTLYIRGYLDSYAPMLQKLGKHKRGKGCLYLKKLADIDLAALEDLVRQSIAEPPGA